MPKKPTEEYVSEAKKKKLKKELEGMVQEVERLRQRILGYIEKNYGEDVAKKVASNRATKAPAPTKASPARKSPKKGK
ncbi:hypothetical protein FACS1894106_2440 [Spirochaetia bacterium]|nr:hypothetical protein FACS1894106_2440 [Spirochaetia bacterium]